MKIPFLESSQWVETYNLICGDCAKEFEVPDYAKRFFSYGDDVCGVLGCSKVAQYEIHVEMLDEEDSWY